jgi:hypothetical protein
MLTPQREEQLKGVEIAPNSTSFLLSLMKIGKCIRHQRKTHRERTDLQSFKSVWKAEQCAEFKKLAYYQLLPQCLHLGQVWRPLRPRPSHPP